MCTAYKPTKLSNYRYGKLQIIWLFKMTYLWILGSGPIPFRDRDWRKHNKHIQDLISKCLEINPDKRITSADAL